MCVCVRAPLIPRHSWLGCTVLVCLLGSGFWAVARPSWLGCWGVLAFVRVPRLHPALSGGPPVA